MAYAFRRDNKGTPSFTGVYEGPDGTRRSAGTFPSRRAALRAAQREEQAVREGRWWDRSLGDITFETYVENSWLPSKHLEATTRAAYRSNLDRHFFTVLRQPADGSDLAVAGSGVGDEGDCRGPVSSVGAQVSRHAAFDL